MSRILIISSVIPVEEIHNKVNENDILFLTEDEIKKRDPRFCFKYFYIFPRSSKVLSLINAKWESYYKIQIKKQISTNSRTIEAVGIFISPILRFINPFLFSISMILEKKRLTKLINEFSPTIIHAHNLKTDIRLAYWIKKKFNIPYVVTTRELSMNCKVKQVYLENAEEFISLGPVHQKEFKKIYKKESRLIPHGISDMFFIEKNRNTNPFLRFLTISRLIKLKNIDKVILALKEIKEDFNYNIYGEGPEEEYLKELVRSNGLCDKIKFHGFIEHKKTPLIYSNHDLFIMPSDPEAFGRVYLEAMGIGIPVIAAKNTGIDGIITTGINGFLVNAGDIVELKELLLELILKPEILFKMKYKVKKIALEFHWDSICAKLNEIYSKKIENDDKF